MKQTSNNLLVYSRASFLRGVKEHGGHTSFNNMQAVLSLHDAVEFCLRAITEEFDIRLMQNDSLMQLFSVIDKHFEPPNPVRKLPRPTQIRFLDATRGKVKHHASVPSPEDTKQCLLHSTAFLEQVCPDYFEVPFERISLVSLIEDESLRHLLYKAEQRIADQQFLEALVFAKLAYRNGRPSAELFLGREHWTRNSFHFGFRPNITIRASSGSMMRGDHREIHIDTSGISSAIQEASTRADATVEVVKSKVERLEQALVHMMIGSDVLAAKRFEEITPRLSFQAGYPVYYWIKGKEATLQMAQEALTYSTETILRWQDMGALQSQQTAQAAYSYEDWEEFSLPEDGLPAEEIP
jgi:hypothetical protein